MSPEELAGLPPAMAIKLLAEHPSIAKYLDKLELPVVPRSPKYDRKIFLKDKRHQWASETQLPSLEHFAKRSKDSADSGGDYAVKDLDQYERLMFWVRFRQVEPTLAVSITRGDDLITAAAPSYTPETYSNQPRGGDTYPNHRAGDTDNDAMAPPEDDLIPF